MRLYYFLFSVPNQAKMKHQMELSYENALGHQLFQLFHMLVIIFFKAINLKNRITNFHIQQQYFTTSNLVSVVFCSFFSKLSSLLKTAPNTLKSFGMVPYTLGQCYTYIRRRGRFYCCCGEAYLEPSQTYKMKLFCTSS